MSVDDPVILTCAISGAVANREQCPAIPYTPEEYAAEARRIVDEGGSMIHIHARTPGGVPCGAGRSEREAHRVPARAAAGGGRAEHGLDELREVLAASQAVRVPHSVRE